MQDIQKVLRRKQDQYAKLAKEIELLQQAAEKMREIAPLLAETDEDETSVLAEVEEDIGQPLAAAARASSAHAGGPSLLTNSISAASPAHMGIQAPASPAEPASPVRPMAPRWP